MYAQCGPHDVTKCKSISVPRKKESHSKDQYAILLSVSTGIVMGVGIFGPALGFGLGAIFSNVYVTMESMYYPFKMHCFLRFDTSKLL